MSPDIYGIHAGGTGRSVNGARLLFVTDEKNIDYNWSVDNVLFEKCLFEMLIPHLPPQSLIVMDNASYHAVIENKLYSSNMIKDVLRSLLSTNGIALYEWITKVDIQDL